MHGVQGARLKPTSLAVTVGRTQHLRGHDPERARLAGLPRGPRVHRDRASHRRPRRASEIGERLRFLDDVGVGYLTLHRASATLSGGEAQRIRLATQIGSALVGVLYILDEPSIGLHQRDNRRLIDTLLRLRDLGNTVIVVEHDEETMRSADHIVDMGPGAGEHGGRVVAEGPPAFIAACAESRDRALPRRRPRSIADARAAASAARVVHGARARACTTCAASTSPSPRAASPVSPAFGFGQVHARQRHPLQGDGHACDPGTKLRAGGTTASTGPSSSTR